jgi:uncharacterized protein YwqG/GNAT superfamily N-acetyltransferase
MSAIITLERPDSADASALITELEAHLEQLYPVESRHGYSVEKLIGEGVAFFVLRDNDTPAGCGGIQLFGVEYGELKRMYVRPRFRGLGFGKLLLNHLADYARARGVGLLRLETGIHQAAAISLYERMGFQRIPPFGNYKEDPLSLCYEKRSLSGSYMTMNTLIQPLLNSLRERIAADPDLATSDLVPLARPSVRLVTQRVPYARIGVGESRIGGVPDVPLGFEWPRWTPSKQQVDKYGQPWHPDGPAPLGFIAQIDLSAVPRVDDTLPSSGWLYFFYDRYCEPWGYDPADRGCCRVIYSHPDRASLVRAQPPSDADPEHTAHSCLVEARPELTLPDDLPEMKYGTPAYKSYRGLCDDLAGAGWVVHRLLGHPQLIQNPMELECQLASNGAYCGGTSHLQGEEAQALEAGAVDWRLLLQIDTDEDGPGWMWGDVGRIYFWIKQQDLASLRFTDIWLVFQCC